MGGGLAAVRLAALWFLVWLESTGRQTISALPLVLLLYPEGLLLPYRASFASVLALSGALVVGSLVAAAALGLLLGGPFRRKGTRA